MLNVGSYNIGRDIDCCTSEPGGEGKENARSYISPTGNIREVNLFLKICFYLMTD